MEENALLPCWLAGTAPPTEFLESLHIEHIRSRPAGLTSLGEQQRTGVGRALVLRPRLVLLDEPTAHQDDDNVDRVLGVVRAAAHAGSAVLVATHDPRVMATADRAVHLDGGRVVPAPD